MPPLGGSWANALKGEFSKDYYKNCFRRWERSTKPTGFTRQLMIFSMRSTFTA